MPDEQSDPLNRTQNSVQGVISTDLSSTLPQLSIKAGLAVFLPAGLLLFFLSRISYLLVHTLIELSSIVLLVAVFLIGWNTRHLVRNQFFVILSIGFLAAGMVDLLHTISYKGMHLLPVEGADTATQLWLVARTLGTCAYLCATLSMAVKKTCSAKAWLLGYMIGGCFLVALIWPLNLMPACLIEGEGLTPFKVNYEYVLIGLLCLAALSLLVLKKNLNQRLTNILLTSIGLSAVSGLMFTLYVDVYGFYNFMGHYFKLGSVVLVYFALVEGTLRSPFATLFRDMSQSYEELNLELQRRVKAERQQKLAHQESSLLYSMSRAMHSTLNLDDLAHLTLSAATAVEAGGFERATLFTVNQRTGMLQGMLGVSQETASMLLPAGGNSLVWEELVITDETRSSQRLTAYNQNVIKQRLPLDCADNALAKAFLDKQVVLVPQPDLEPAGGQSLAKALEFGPYACTPLTGREQTMGVLVVDNPLSKQEVSSERKHFLELFSSQAGSALENASLVKKLEMAHDNLKDVQEQLIHGEKMAVLGEMAAQVAHELRNPLVSIGGFAQRLSKQDLKDAKANEYADIIAREVRRMEEMLDNILSFSKKQLVCFERCNISRLLQEVVDLEFEHCQKQGIEISADLPQTLPEIVGDYRQLRQVFFNLMINARQVMSEGGVLSIRAKSGSLRGEKAVIIAVEDTGGGISPEVMRNIFNPFFSTFAKGTGLGLSISHRIVAHHHGEIEVINADLGARFVVVLPVAQPGLSQEQAVIS